MRGWAVALVVMVASAVAPPGAESAGARSAPGAGDSVLAQLRAEARALRPLARSSLGRAFLDAASLLPAPPARLLWRDSSGTRWFGTGEVRPESTAGLVSRAFAPEFYYHTRYGTPLAYGRAFDLLGRAGVRRFEGLRLLDFGYGGIGQLRMAAALGAEAVGVDVDPVLRALYTGADDQGEVRTRRRLPGRVRLVHGSFPGDSAVAATVGGGYAVILSKNTLKRGYVHPEQPADPRQLVHLGVDDSTFVAEVYARLRPGGLFLIYNLSPAPARPGERYIPWADGRCPFARERLERAGFQVLAYDVEDDAAARSLGRRLGWDQGASAMDLEHDLFGRYTLARKPVPARSRRRA